MPEIIQTELWQLITTVIYFLVGVGLFGFAIWLFAVLTPFSVRKELEEDQNVAMGILMGSALIALGIVLAAAIK